MVVYNLGQQDIMLRDSNMRVNDGKYHVVRFVRTGVNSTLQVDDNQVRICTFCTKLYTIVGLRDLLKKRLLTHGVKSHD